MDALGAVHLASGRRVLAKPGGERSAVGAFVGAGHLPAAGGE